MLALLICGLIAACVVRFVPRTHYAYSPNTVGILTVLSAIGSAIGSAAATVGSGALAGLSTIGSALGIGGGAGAAGTAAGTAGAAAGGKGGLGGIGGLSSGLLGSLLSSPPAPKRALTPGQAISQGGIGDFRSPIQIGAGTNPLEAFLRSMQ
jgi:hypothetical protein